MITRRLTTSNKGKGLRWGCTCVCSRWHPPTISTLKPSFHHQHPVPKLTIICQALLLYHMQRYPNTASEPPYPASSSMTSPIILPYPCLHHPLVWLSRLLDTTSSSAMSSLSEKVHHPNLPFNQKHHHQPSMQ